MSKDTGGSAFPNDGSWANGHSESGMTLRDYFAAQTLSGWLANAPIHPAEHPVTAQEAAELAYKMADAMLAERNGK